MKQSMSEDEILACLLADLELPPEAAEYMRGTARFKRAVLGHRLRALGETIVESQPKWLHWLVRRVFRQPAA
jgi:uncharacterized membrane-anchored protein